MNMPSIPKHALAMFKPNQSHLPPFLLKTLLNHTRVCLFLISPLLFIPAHHRTLFCRTCHLLDYAPFPLVPLNLAPSLPAAMSFQQSLALCSLLSTPYHRAFINTVPSALHQVHNQRLLLHVTNTTKPLVTHQLAPLMRVVMGEEIQS